MNAVALEPETLAETRAIVVDEVFPHAPETIWRTLTDGSLMEWWLMRPQGFAAVVGTRFTFQTRPGGAWDGTIRCEVLEVTPNERLRYRWQGGHASNVGYGALLDTIVTWTLAAVDGGTRLRLEHAGFKPENDTAFKTMGEGWKTVVKRLGELADEPR
jgi:uncharacterized protein YndB with AHSA1/START domain